MFKAHHPTRGQKDQNFKAEVKRNWEQRKLRSSLKLRKPVNHTSWVALVTPTDRPKSVRNRCLIEVFVALFVLSLALLIFLLV